MSQTVRLRVVDAHGKPTLGMIFDEYLKMRCVNSKAVSLDHYRAMYRRYLMPWDHLPIEYITAKMVLDRHRDLGEVCPVQANRAFEMLSAIFTYAITIYSLPINNPVENLTLLKAWHREKSNKDKYIELQDLRLWMQSVRAIQGPAADLFVFLLLTGFRLREAAQLQWSDLDLDRGLIYLGYESRGSTFVTKSGVPHQIPISTYLISLLKVRRYTRSGPYVFGWGRQPITSPHNSARKVSRTSGVHFTPQHLRRSFANFLTHPAVGADAMEIKALLNHTDDVTSQYYLTLHPERLRPIMERLSLLVLRESGLLNDAGVVSPDEPVAVEVEIIY